MLKAPRYLLIPLCFAVGSLSMAGLAIRSAPVMPEAKKFLALAHKNLSDKAWDTAAAYAGAILISDEVSINVNVDAVPSGQRDSCKRAVDQAIAKWESALDNTLHFRMEDDPTKADIELTYQPDVRFQSEQVAGVTTWKHVVHSTDGKVTGITRTTEVHVRTQDPRFKPMTLGAMRQATEHEFGHVLGLEDSEHMGDLMGQLDLDHPVSGPRDYEVSTVKALREEARQIKADAESKSSQ
jgi:hypothetical protein